MGVFDGGFGLIARLNSSGIELKLEYSAKETARILGVKRKHLKGLIRQNGLEPNDKGGYDATAIRDFIDMFDLGPKVPPPSDVDVYEREGQERRGDENERS